MPTIQKGAKLNDADKKKLDKMKAKGASKSELSTIRMALLRGDTWRKALNKGKTKRTMTTTKPADKKSKKTEVETEVVVGEDEM